MNKFEVSILGCGSALPTMQHLPSCQVVNIREKLFMIDCGEGSQLQFRRARLKFSRLNRIFISHLHGDHCFGLIGLISTLGLLGRTGDLYIHSEPKLEELLRPQLKYFCTDLSYAVVFKPFDPSKNEVIYEDRSVKVSTIPLKHRVPSCGFLFEEAQNELHLDGEAVKFYDVPVKNRIELKQGLDFVTPEGKIIPNKLLTKPASPSRKYAYCSDTALTESIIPIIKGADLLYHEATFLDEDIARASATTHTTAKQAAELASKAGVKKLMIGHYSSRYSDDNSFLDEARAIFADTILANELLTKKL